MELDPTSRLIVQTVLRDGPIARAAIARQTGLSSGSLTRLTTPLVTSGILRETGAAPAPVGRPSLPLEVVDGVSGFIGVKVVVGELHAVRTGLRGEVHAHAVRPADTSSIESTASAIAEVATQIRGDVPVAAIGVALAAAVDPFGTVRAAALLGWPGGNLSAAVTKATGLPCTSANDVDALTLAEHWFGHGRGARHFAVVTIGAGVGAGAVVGDTLLLGHQGSAGMLGEAWTSHGRRFHDVLSTPALTRDLATGEREVVLDQAAEALGELIVLATLAWGPQRVLVTGEGIGIMDGRRHLVEECVQRHRFLDVDTPELVVDELDFLDWARGAAALAIRLSLEL